MAGPLRTSHGRQPPRRLNSIASLLFLMEHTVLARERFDSVLKPQQERELDLAL